MLLGTRFLLFLFRPTNVTMVGWFYLLLGVVLVHGNFAYSPIEVPEEEWREYAIMMRDVAFRLPTTTRPRHYEVTLTPYFNTTVSTTVDPFSFDGEVNIFLSPTQAGVNEIVIHCNDLTINTLTVTLTTNTVNLAAANQVFQCEMPYSFLRIALTEALALNQEYVVRSTFRGNLQTNMRGFYRSWYDDSIGRRWMATTQFQPGHARQAFPCYDEPGFKATFDITMNRENDFSPTISNMPIRETIQLANGRVAETFFTTPVTSTYLLAFIVSHYEVVAQNNNVTRPFYIYARDNAGSTGDWSLDIGERLLVAMEEYTQIPYYSMAANMNMKQAAIPDFSAGAMENWGLLTYREALILYDELNSNHFYKQRVANIVSHEIAHMWFGNLVTCAWWDNLWLNEGFARFYQYYLTGSVEPELGYATRFIVEQLHVSLLSDSIDSAHPLTDLNVNDPTTVSAHFSTITYAKGASILRMTQYLLGEDTYLKGLRLYLQNRSFDVAKPEDLFSALDAAAAEDNALSTYNGLTIDQYFKTWSEQAGHPLLSVSINHSTGTMIVTQSRFERTSGVSQNQSLYLLPITWTRGGAPDFVNLKPSQVLSAQATTIDRGSTGWEWVIFNKQQSGFYRVNYDVNTWTLITRALRSNDRLTIHEYNRAQIIDDVFLLARSTILPYSRAFNIISFLEFEDQYAPWIAAITGYNFAVRRLAHNTDSLEKLNQLIISQSVAITNRLGYAEVANESYMDGLLRMYVMQFLCNIGHQQCINAGVQNFQNWKNGGFIPANMRPWVYCVGLRYGTADDYNYFWNRYLAEDLANEQVVMLQAAGCTTDQNSLNAYLNAIVSGDDSIRAQDHSTAISSAITSNEVNTMRVFEWLKSNVAQTTATLGSVSTILSSITSRLLNEVQISEVSAWLEENSAAIGTASYNTGISGIATARANMQWYNQRVSEFETYFESGYVDESDIDIEEVEEEVIDQEITEPAPGSANVAAFSIFTMIVTLAVNMF